jgi:hypothetical protein
VGRATLKVLLERLDNRLVELDELLREVSVMRWN